METTMTALATIDNPEQHVASARDASARRDRAGVDVRLWLHAEGAAALVAGLAIYLQAGGNPWFFVPFLLVPDVAMIGYAAGPRIGAITYNAIHNWAVGLAVLGAAAVSGSPALWIVGAILVAHVGMDRTLGYGLKYPTGFRSTHLQRV
jgi:hypothetical protein